MLGENTALSEKPDAGPGVPAVLCDRFVLEERLEQGRFGAMYRALDRLRGPDGRAHVAVLVLPPEVARHPDQLAAFERELEAVRLLSHPNIVRMFGLERDGDKTFLVLEWVDGESLRSVIDSLAPETVCEADALGVVRAVGNALVYAHARGVVHGDVRPENVLVTERGEVRLLFTSACLASTAPFTITPRDDVRGLAALAYELMSGSPPPIGGLYPGGTDEPEPVEGLNRKRWKALRSAMSMRDGRISSIRKLLAALDLPEPRAPRRGSRPDRIRDRRPGALKRVAVVSAVCAGVAALVVVGPRVWNDKAEELAGLSASVESGAGRAANLTREGLAGARDRLGRAGNALGALWSELGERAESAGDAGQVRNDVEAGDDAADTPAADDAVPDAELFEAEELNGVGESAPDVAPADTERAEGSDAATAEGDRAAPAEGDGAASVEGDGAASAGDRAQPADDRAAPVDRTVPAESDRAVSAEAETAGDESPGRSERAAADDAAAPAAESGGEPQSERTSDSPNDSESASATVAAAPEAAAPSSGRVTFSRGDYLVSESEGVAAIEVRREGARGDAAFVWWTRDGSARSGDDYADLGRRVEELGDGETTRVLYVPITSDSIVEERRETFEVHLGVLSEDGSQSGALESVQVTIIDDDG